MIRNYIIIAWRSLLKNRLFSFINIFGLALSMSVCMMVMIQLAGTFSIDNFHPRGERIYRVISEIKNHEGQQWTFASSPLPLLPILAADTNLFEASVNLYTGVQDEASDGIKEISVNGAFTQSSFFDVFGFALAWGDERTALTEPNSIVLSRKTAQKFFNDENPVGKLLTFHTLGVFQITGVLQESGKSHIDLDVYISSSTVQQLENSQTLPAKSESWNSFQDGYTYLVLHENITEKNLGARLERLSTELNKDSNTKDPNSGTITLKSQALSSITPGTDAIYNEIGRGTTWGKVMASIGIALIILVAACFNYTNLSIARALTRTKEVGIRKVAGAKRSQIFLQYITESVLTALFALWLALAILSFILEYQPFSDVYEAVSQVQLNLFIVSCFLLFALFAGVLAGALPAWIMSSFRAVKMLRNLSVEKIMPGITLRKVLIVFQFSLSLVVMIFLSAFYNQFAFMSDAEPGFRRDNIISISFSGDERDVISTELSRIGGVESITSLSGVFGKHGASTMPVSLEKSSPQPFRVECYYADEGMAPVMDLKFAAGSNFKTSARVTEQEIILNQKAVELLGFKSAADAIGQTIWVDDTVSVAIAGVVHDFYNKGVGRALTPVAFRMKSGMYKYLVLQVNPMAGATIAGKLEQTWKKIYPDRAFSYFWLGEQFQEEYDQKSSVSFLAFLAFITVSIAALGLLGLVVYTVETKRKEISIRKIIGSSIPQLILLLSRGFAGLLVVAGMIALPVGFIVSKMFLMNFANQVSFGLLELIVCFLFLLLVGLSLIFSQTYKAAAENPVKNLKRE
jgi:putative ABC transport system permease protein